VVREFKVSISNEPLYLRHFASIFEESWKNGIEADDRIRDIEERVDSAVIVLIPNPKDGIARAWSSIRAATEEVSIMISSAIALRRQIRMAGLQLLKDASEGHGAKVRLLIPDDADGHISLQ
jgi:two-component system, OmpR family, sensor histidine kinase VicK